MASFQVRSHTPLFSTKPLGQVVDIYQPSSLQIFCYNTNFDSECKLLFRLHMHFIDLVFDDCETGVTN